MSDDDDVKAALRELGSQCPGYAWQTGVLRAHIDAESARVAALADEIATLRKERDDLEIDLRGAKEGPLVVVTAAEHDELLALRARVAELEEALSEASDIRGEVDRRTLKAEARVAELEAEQEARDDVMTAEQRLKFWKDNPHACPIHFGARTACGQCFDSTAQQLSNERVESAATLNDLRKAEAERDALKAQVEAARRLALVGVRRGVEMGEWLAEAVSRDVLAAMDEAKP